MTGNGKPTFAMYGAGSCGGCEIAVLNIHEKILEVAAAFDVVFWPTIMDAKYRDVEEMADGSITVTLFNGGLRTDETVELAHLLRRKSRFLVAFGSCAGEGCIPGLANLSSRARDLRHRLHHGHDREPGRDRGRPDHYEAPEGVLHLPEFLPMLKTLDQVVHVDYTIPGCPPESHQIAAVLDVLVAALNGTGPLPPPGSVIGAGTSTVCDECARKRDVKKIKQFVRIQDVASFDPVICLLEQGLPCSGPATRDGCGALCPAVGAPCIGCYGASDGVIDYGARLMTAFASVIDANDPDEIDPILDGIPDPAGQFYRFSLAKSLLRASRSAWNDGEQLTMERITIDPITRLEGHGKIEIFLDADGEVANAYFQIPELRGFEQFCVGRPVEEMPNLTNRICGVCPEAHHMAATKAADAVYHVDPPRPGRLLRELLYSVFYVTDHTTHFYALGGPDFVVGPDAPAAERNILGVMAKVGLEIGGKVIKMRRAATTSSR